MKRILSILLAFIMIFSFAGCGDKAANSNSDKIVITVGNWPDKNSSSVDYERWESLRTEFMKMYPNIEIERDNWGFTIDSFLAKAAANQLPTVFRIPYTEVDKVIDAGYAADLTEKMKEYEYTDNLADNVREILERDGKIYMIPLNMYAMGLLGNRAVFEEAGLLNEDGTIPYPQTLEELGELSGKIKKKTGKAGFILPTMNNYGGWHFMTMAWSYGVDFMEKQDNKWVAKFNSPEFIEALQFVKDLKWKYDALSDNAFIDGKEATKMYAGGQGAMFISPADSFSSLVTTYGMNKENISMGKIPAGPKGQYSLMGGNLYMVSKDSTPEQIDAAFKWSEHMGYTSRIKEETKKTIDSQYKEDNEQGKIVLSEEPFKIYKSGEANDYKDSIMSKYQNVNYDYFKEYFDMTGVIIKAEEPVSCQQLYSILDSCIQSVLTDKNADIEKIAKDAANDFQKNYLDNVSY